MNDSIVTAPPSASQDAAASDRLDAAESRFATALSRLEGGVAHAVHQVAELARRTGWDDGHTEGRKEGHAEGYAEGLAEGRTQVQPGSAPACLDMRDEALSLREALSASRARERDLAAALEEAQAAIHAAMDEIRAFVGEN
jgi:flagellar biosynthesis/type III secretory pathway protein FliH